MKVSDVVAAALQRHGISLFFGQSNPISFSISAEEAGMRQIFYRTENAGGVMADGYSRITRKISVLVAQNGPAATLAVAPMSEALTASLPMLVLVQEVPASLRDRNAFQELDHFALFAGVSKWVRRLDDPARADDYVDLAITVANSGRPGPVVLLLPRDVLDMEAKPARFARSRSSGTFPLDRTRPDPESVRAAVDALATARSPLIVAGGGVHLSGAAQELQRLAEIGQIPVVTTNMGKGGIGEDHPLSLGVAANVTGENGPAHFHIPLIAGADVVLFVGSRTNENGTDGWTLTSPEATYIHIDVDSLEVGRNYEAIRLVGDALLALQDVSDGLARADLSQRTAGAASLLTTISEGRRRHKEVMAPIFRSDQTPILPQRMLAELDALLTADDIVVADASYASIWVSSYLTAKRTGQRFLLPRGMAGLGWGMPLGMGAKLASPASRVVAIVGDGGFAHVWSEIETAVRENIPVVVILLNNGLLGYQRHAENLFYGKTSSAIAFAPVDHAAVARAAGALGVRIEDPADLRGALEAALAADTLTVLDVIVDADAYAPSKLWDGNAAKMNLK
ncbi:acetolactate synthase catalytic subunit [Sphingomonas naphthae]|uniref:Acetolactate synthase catalytic subunit n=1 Tax=Sphingomonas naphthae TaxID=1813468 RepID=A0ABY7TMR5_9SPHN|nr:acetolactate synthase catalytic subunit [Sphingomonas naphthae]WCT74523.1 acetolactate synthase catalytic subunit [Sphingomonas naphthae]